MIKRKPLRVLMIDDDLNLCTVVSHQLEGMGFSARAAHNGESGLAAFEEGGADLVLLDMQMPGLHGMEVLDRLRALDEEVPIIVITAYGTVDAAVEACRKGADDYLTKPFAREQLRFSIQKAVRFKRLEKDNLRLRGELSDRYSFGKIVTRNRKMRRLLELAARAAGSPAGILILGESGTGKELLARAIHHTSPRRDKPFVAASCPSIPDALIESELFGHEKGAFTGAVRDRPGKFELADGGTLFLDEIGDLKLDLQAKLLRALQEREIERVGGIRTIPVDVRVIAATNRDLAGKVAHGEFREDLYYRINIIPLKIPPLRERGDDIPLLARQLAEKHAGRPVKIEKELMRIFLNYDWPGNVRELENMLQRAIVLCEGDRLTAECMETSDPARGPDVLEERPVTLADIERRAVLDALKASGGNRSQAARRLGVPRHILLYRLKKYRLDERD